MSYKNTYSVSETTWLEMSGLLMNDEIQELWTVKIITLTRQNLLGGTEDNQEVLRVPGIPDPHSNSNVPNISTAHHCYFKPLIFPKRLIIKSVIYILKTEMRRLWA
jgi:hypothetical protein